MGDAKRWTVIYTKHVKQKRKVYQDGVLELQISTGVDQAVLYDDTGNVLDSRFLKKNEVIECNGTFTFNGYLVDIGDSEEKSKPLTKLNVPRDKEPVAKFGWVHRKKKAGYSLHSIGSIKSNGKDNGVSENQPSLIHNIKKENEKSDYYNHGVQSDHLNATIRTGTGNKQVLQQKAKASHAYWKGTPATATSSIIQKTKEAPTNKLSATQGTEVQEWNALYTTHITQKAKRYHDGNLRLEFRGSHGKQVMLYDASKELLDSRFLKKDEVIRSGVTVAFDTHLVDIGDLKDNRKSLSNVDVQRKDGNKVIDLENIDAKEKTTHIMQDTREWHALYTTQITQKQKKYHDGILRLAYGAAQRKQVILIHEDGTHLSSKYLNSSKDVRTESTLQLANYLVQVGEACVSQRGELQIDASLMKETSSCSSSSKVDGIKLTSKGTRKNYTHDGPRNDASAKKDSGSYSVDSTSVLNVNFGGNDAGNKLICDEWHALYTTQIAQKAKKYHDGILRLAYGAAHRKQVILLNEDRTLLSSKYLNSSEEIRTGITLRLTNYLVDIVEARVSQGGELQNDTSLTNETSSYCSSSKVDGIKLNGKGTRNNSTHDGPKNDASAGKDLGSYSSDSTNVKNVKASGNDTGNKLIRDAHQILFILKRPAVQETLAPIRKSSMAESHSSQSSDIPFGIEGKLLVQNAVEQKFSKRNVVGNLENNPKASNVESTADLSWKRSNVLQPKEAQCVPSSCIINSVGHDNGGEIESLNPSSNVSLGKGALSSPNSKTGLSLEKAATSPTSSVLEPPISNTAMPEDKAACASMQNNGLNFDVQIKEPYSFTGKKGSNDGDCQMTSYDANENLIQPYTDNGEIDSSSDAARGSRTMIIGISEGQSEMHDFPSFDIGI